MLRRIVLAAVGAAGGLALWALSDPLLDSLGPTRLWLFASALVAGFFLACLMLTDLRRTWPALAAGAAIALPAALLLLAGSSRYGDIRDYLTTIYPVAAWLALVLVPVPYVASRLEGGGWLDPEAICDLTWSLTLRMIGAFAFTLVFLLVLLLCGLLLDLVGIEILTDLLAFDAEGWTIAGGLFGLSLAVIDEFGGDRSADLVTRLVRLLAPVAAAVLIVFLAALPVRGLTDLFGTLSPAAIMLTMAVLAAVVVSAAVDADEERQADGTVLLSARALALLLIAPVGLAVTALALRIGEYGWTLPRAAGALIAIVMFLYGIAYLSAALLRWPDGIRRVNPVLGLAIAAASVLWLLPGPGPETLTARSVEALVRGGAADEGDWWLLKDGLGRPGLAALERLRTDADPTRIAILDDLEAAEDRGAFRRQAGTDIAADDIDRLAALLPGVPRGALASLTEGDRDRLTAACGRVGTAGTPDCTAFAVEIDPRYEGPEYVLLRWDEGRVEYIGRALYPSGWGGLYLGRYAGEFSWTYDEFLALQQTPPEPRPAPLMLIDLGGLTLMPQP